MSPGGLFSGALGFGAVAFELLPPRPDDAPPQPATASTATTVPAAMSRRAGERPARGIMGATVGAPRHRPVPARSTPGQTFRRRACGPYADGRVTSDGILIVEDDEAIASGLARALD